MSDSLISKRHLAQQEWHVDPVGPLETVNLRTVKRIIADAIGGTLTLDDVVKGLTPGSIGAVGVDDIRLFDARKPLAHVASHALLGMDRLAPSDIGAMEPPPGTGKSYLATGGGWIEYVAPELDISGIVTITNHAELQNRDAADQHPQSAIQYLASDLATIRSDIDDLNVLSELLSDSLADKSDASHSHEIAAANGLAAVLLEKADVSVLSSKADVNHAHSVDGIPGLVDALDTLSTGLSGKANADDTRLSNARTPLAHAETHAPNGTDSLTGYATLDVNGTVDAAQIPIGSATQRGVLQVDGTTITEQNGVISAVSSGPSGGGIDVWTEDKYFAPPKVVFGSDNNLYKALSENGPGTVVGVRDPVSEPMQSGISIDSTEATLPASSSWRSVAYGDGVFVAVIHNSVRVAYSTDGGKSWVASTLLSTAHWSSVAYGDGVFVAVVNGSTTAAYSTDGGKTWTAGVLPSSANWSSLTFGNGVFVAIAENSTAAAYSTDGGKTWKSATLPKTANWTSVTHGGGIFVAVAYGSTAAAAYSTDGGKTWNASTLPSSGSWYSITYGDGVFVTVAYNSTKGAYSIDGGKTWNTSTLPITANWRSVAYGDGVFVAVIYGSSEAIIYSVDNGKTWILADAPSAKSLYFVAYGEGVFVAVPAGSATSVTISIGVGYLPNCWTLVG